MKHLATAAFVAIAIVGVFAQPAAAQQQSCLGADKLSIQAAQTRSGPGGNYNYVARIANASTQTIRFDVRFVMANAQPNRDIIPFTQSLNGRTFREVVLASGPAVVEGARIIENVRLMCR